MLDELEMDLALTAYTGAASDSQRAAAAAGLGEFRAALLAQLQVSAGWLEGRPAGDAEAAAWAGWCALAVRNWDEHFPEFAADLDGVRERLDTVLAALDPGGGPVPDNGPPAGPGAS